MESLLSVTEILNAVKGECFSQNKDKLFFSSVATDSRNVVKNTLFVPLIGEFQNGHKYIPQAVEKGASVVFVKKNEYSENAESYNKLISDNKNLCLITVENTLTALQNAAEAYVSKFPNLTKISITGSCGKTTTKEMLVSIFKAKFQGKVIFTQGNFNSETGLPLSVFNIRKNHEYGIFEMGMNRENEIGEISKVLKSKYGIITNIGTAHIGILGSRENIAKEKRKSFNYIPKDGAVFVPSQDDFADYCTQNVNGKIIKFGTDISEDKSGVKFIKNNGLKGICFTVDGLQINLPLSGEHNYINALGVIALARECKIEKEYIKAGLESMNKLSGRMEIQDSLLKNGNKITIVKDCYNANPDSMEKVIDFISSVENIGKRIFVLADMLELGDKSKSAHKEIGNILINKKFDYVFLIGKEMGECSKVLKENGLNNYSYFETNSEETFNSVEKKLLEMCKNEDVVVFKGSHSMALENIIPEIVENE